MNKEDRKQSFTKIPATVITGFLGSGKTSLIQHLISTANGRQLAFIINEFGDLGVDKELLLGCGIENCTDNDIVELANGCICCTVADDFLPTMKLLLDRPNPPDHIIIETSGLALPKPLLKAFTWPEVRTRATVDGVIAVIDSAAVAAGLFANNPSAVQAQRMADESLDHESALEELFEEQIQSADIIVFNKADAVTEESWAEIECQVAKFQRPKVKSIRTNYGRIDSSILLGLGAGAEFDLDSRPSHHDKIDSHDHEDFDSFVIDLQGDQTEDALLNKLNTIIEKHNILRIKGFVSISNKPMRLAVQAVGTRIETYFDKYWSQNDKRYSKLVVIGQKGLDKEKISNAIIN
jgi:cobalamin biosynthesis protein CobW